MAFVIRRLYVVEHSRLNMSRGIDNHGVDNENSAAIVPIRQPAIPSFHVAIREITMFMSISGNSLIFCVVKFSGAIV